MIVSGVERPRENRANLGRVNARSQHIFALRPAGSVAVVSRRQYRQTTMTKRTASAQPAAPLTFDLPVELMDKIEVCRKSLGLASASEVIREAITRFDFSKCQPVRVPHRQISVRLSGEHRATLKRQARLKDVSIGELLRLAIEGLQPKAVRPAKKKR